MEKLKPFLKDNYYIPDISDVNLKRKGFNLISIDEIKIYEYSFVVAMYKQFPTLKCNLHIFPDEKKVNIDVTDMLNKTYAPFYYQEYGAYEPLLNEINSNIRKELKKLGIKQCFVKNKKHKIK